MTAPDSAPADEHRRMPALDGLRGLAVGGVLLAHVFAPDAFYLGSYPPEGLDLAYQEVVRIGWIGVNLFFILSGFLITGILYESKGPALSYFRNFYARRALRIFPAYYGLLLVMIFLLPDLILREKLWIFGYLMNLREFADSHTMFLPGFLVGHYLIGHLWSLAVEEQFYFIWPVFVLLLPRKYLIGVSTVAIVTALVVRFVMHQQGQPNIVIYTFTPARMDDLAIGALIALLVRDASVRHYMRMYAGPVAILALVGLVMLFFARGTLSHRDPYVVTGGLTMIGVFLGSAFTAVILSSPTGRINSLLSWAPARWMGRHSYAIYLIHFPVVGLILFHTTFYNSFPEVFGSIIPRMIYLGLVCTAITLVLAAGSWRYVEKQFLKLRPRFPQASGMTTWRQSQ